MTKAVVDADTLKAAINNRETKNIFMFDAKAETNCMTD